MNHGARKLRVVLADDHPEVLERFHRILAGCHDVVATVSDGESVLSAVAEFSPDVVVCDISMPGMNGFEIARELVRRTPGIKIVFLTVHAELDYVSEAFRLGVRGYLLKTSVVSELNDAVRAVASGESYVSARLRRTC